MTKQEINLRPHEFVVARTFYWPRFLLTLLLALLGLGLVLGTLGAYYHQLALEMERDDLQSRNLAMREELQPLEDMERDINRLQDREEHIKELEELRLPWYHYLDEIYDTAGEGITIHSINAEVEGGMSISGTGDSMSETVLAMKKLEELDFLSDLSYSSLNRDDEARYSFSFSGSLSVPTAPNDE